MATEKKRPEGRKKSVTERTKNVGRRGEYSGEKQSEERMRVSPTRPEDYVRSEDDTIYPISVPDRFRDSYERYRKGTAKKKSGGKR